MSELTLLQVAVIIVAALLVLTAFLYVPYEIPDQDGLVYGWIWARVVYNDPLVQEAWDQVDKEDLKRQIKELEVDPEFVDRGQPGRREAMVAFWPHRRNIYLSITFGLLAFFAVRFVERRLVR